MMTQSGQWFPSYAGQQPLQDQEFLDFMRRQGIISNGQSMQGQQQKITPPIIHADIIQVDDTAAINRFPPMSGDTQMYWTKDEHTIVVRTILPNGQSSDRRWKEEPPETPAPTLNPSDYVRRDELADLIAAALQAQQTPQTTRKTKKEDET